MNLSDAVVEFERLLKRIQPSFVQQFKHWVEEHVKQKDVPTEENSKQEDDILERIIKYIRECLPQTGMSSTETFYYPSNCKMRSETTIHVDAFLYDDDLFDSLCEQGKMSRNFCTNCGSKEIQPLTVITHSASIHQIKFIFQHVLGSLHNKTLIDVGSRTGAILYGAYLYTDCKYIIGVEIDTTFCRLQEQVISSFNLHDKIMIIHDDILNQMDLIRKCDVLVLNNVFEFFLPMKQQERIWKQLSVSLIRPGTMLVTVPSVEESLKYFETGINVSTWLKPVDIREQRHSFKQLMMATTESDSDEIDSIYLYEVI